MDYSQKIFGVLNITEDSFFDGKRYLNSKKAIQQAHLLKEQGAEKLHLLIQKMYLRDQKVLKLFQFYFSVF